MFGLRRPVWVSGLLFTLMFVGSLIRYSAVVNPRTHRNYAITDQRVAEREKRNERTRQFFYAGLAALLGVGVVVGLVKSVRDVKGWLAERERQRAPWERES